MYMLAHFSVRRKCFPERLGARPEAPLATSLTKRESWERGDPQQNFVTVYEETIGMTGL